MFVLYNNKLPILLVVCTLSLAPASLLSAEMDYPGWQRVEAAPVSPDTAETYYQSAHNGVSSAKNVEPISAESAVMTPELDELARALQHDPVLIYNYVHQNIDYQPYFGSLKGATLTYYDRSGNDFDQASLMIALLRASGYTARYECGKMKFPFSLDSPLTNWVGSAANDVSILASGGIPTEHVEGDVFVTRAWVRATIEGVDYLFDPAFKEYSYSDGIELQGAIGYDRAQLLTSAGGTITQDWVQGMNENGLRQKLVECSTNLVSYLRQNHPNDAVSDVIGGRSISESELVDPQTSLAFPTTLLHTWDSIPVEYSTILRIQHVGIDHTFDTAELAGQRLTITYAGGDNHPELHLGGQLIAAGQPTTLGASYDLVLTVDHPYAADNGTYCDQTTTYSNKSGATYTVIYNFGGSSQALINRRQQLVDQYEAQGLPKTSEQVLGETLNVIGLTWFKETRMAECMLAWLEGDIVINHHSIGRVAQEDGYYIDVATASCSVLSRDAGDAGHGDPTFYASTCIASAFEHAVIEQLTGSEATSTIRLLQRTNSLGRKLFWATSSSFPGIRPQLTNYSASQLDSFQSRLAGNTNWLILPEDARIALNQWQGIGYIQKQTDSDGDKTLGMIIGGRLYGGYCSVPGTVDPSRVQNNSLWDVQSSIMAWIDHLYSSDPIDMCSGSFVHEHADLSLGQASPLGLSFSRTYNSSLNRSERTLGFGWTHSYDIYLDKISDVNPGLGARQPVDAAPLITALFISLDLHRNEDNLRGWVVDSLIHKWASDQLIRNAVNIHFGGKVSEYVKLADGTYQAPPGDTTCLIDNGDGTFSVRERFGTQTDFNASGRISSTFDIDGNTLSFSYADDRLTRVQDAFGRSLTMHYVGGQISSVTDSTGRMVSYIYNEAGDMTGYTDPEGKVWSYGYDGNHRMTSLANPLAITTATNGYDSLGRVSTQTTPRQGNATATYRYYFTGLRNVEEDPLGNQTVYYYDDLGRLVRQRDALGNESVQAYDGQNHITESIDARDNLALYDYDGNQNLVRTIDALVGITDFTYDERFRLVCKNDPLGHETLYAYDQNHHPMATTDAVGNTTASTYYPNGLRQSTTDPRGAMTTFTYDQYGHMRASRVGSHNPVTYAYDPIGRMIGLTDQVGASTVFMYDRRGLLLSVTDPLGRSTTYGYDDAGQTALVTDRNGDTASYRYTPTGKVDTITLPDTSTISFAYDTRDNLVAMRDHLGTTAYTYDALNRLVSTSDPYGFVVSYAYDAKGNLTSLTYPGGKTVRYAYDGLDRLVTVTDWIGRHADYQYDAAGRLTNLKNSNTTVTTYSYDQADRLIGLDNRRTNGTALATYSFTLDAKGNRVRSVQFEPVITMPMDESLAYSYNQQRNRLLSAGDLTFSWDAQGQLTAMGDGAYSFDALHRMVSADGTAYQFAYDGNGRRLSAVRNGQVTRYIHDSSGRLLAEADSAGNVMAYYVHGLGLLARVTPAEDMLCYHFNAIGSTIALTDAGGSVVNHYAYEPFGRIASQVEATSQPFKFVGQHGVMAEPNGFYFMSARYYDPSAGRFISEDPKGFEGGDENLFAYVANNPVNYADPSGECPMCVTLIDKIVVMGPAYIGTVQIAVQQWADKMAIRFAPLISNIVAGLEQGAGTPPSAPQNIGGAIGLGYFNRDTFRQIGKDIAKFFSETQRDTPSGRQPSNLAPMASGK